MSEENANDDAAIDADAEQLLADAMQSDTGDKQGSDEPGGQGDDELSRLRAELAKKDADIDKWKKMSRKHEATAKSMEPAAKRLAELEDSQKSEQQKLTEKLSAAEVELAQFRTREVRMNAAVAAGLPAEMAKFITEVEPEGAEEQAKELANHLKPAEPKPAESKPADLRQGARGAAAKPAEDPNAWLRKLAGRA